MAYDYSKLSGRIVEKCKTQRSFSKKMQISEATVSKLLNGDIPWKQTEIEKAVIILDLSNSDIPTYFFSKKLT